MNTGVHVSCWIKFFPRYMPRSVTTGSCGSFILSSVLFCFFFLRNLRTILHGLPCGLSSQESACECRRRGFDPWGRKIPWRRKWQPTPAFLPGKSHQQRSLAGYSPWGHKEPDMTERLNNTQFSPKWLRQFTLPPAMQEDSFLSATFPGFVICRLFDIGHSDWYEVILHCSFICI